MWIKWQVLLLYKYYIYTVLYKNELTGITFNFTHLHKYFTKWVLIWALDLTFPNDCFETDQNFHGEFMVVHCCVGSISGSWTEYEWGSGSVLAVEALYLFCRTHRHREFKAEMATLAWCQGYNLTTILESSVTPYCCCFCFNQTNLNRQLQQTIPFLGQRAKYNTLNVSYPHI